MIINLTRRVLQTAVALCAVTAIAAAFSPATATAVDTKRSAPGDQIQCPRGFVCIYPEIHFAGQPYVKRAVDGSIRHLPDSIRGKGSSIINNSSRTARVYQKDNYFGRHVCVGADGGSIGDLRSYQLNDTTHSLNKTSPCGATHHSCRAGLPGAAPVHFAHHARPRAAASRGAGPAGSRGSPASPPKSPRSRRC